MTPTDNRPCTCHPDDAPPAPCARRYALAECRDIQANVMDRAQRWLNAADERGINMTDENGYLAVIRDMMLEVVRLNERAERAEAERDALRECVKAADAMYASADHTGGNPGCYRCDAADDFLAARAKVKP